MIAWTGIQSQKLSITPDIKNQIVLKKLICKLIFLDLFFEWSSGTQASLKLMKADVSSPWYSRTQVRF